MHFRPGIRTVLFCLFLSQLDITLAQQADTDDINGSDIRISDNSQTQIVEFHSAFFSRYRPDTALDMVLQIPGFELNDGDESRGFASAAGNILINGRRPSSKEDAPSAILNRIPASLVERIELIRGQVRGVDLRGQTVVANIFLQKDVPAAVRWETAVRKHFDVDRLFMTGDISISDSWHDIDYNLGLFIERNANGERGIEDIFNGTDVLTERRNDNIHETGHEGNINFNMSTWLGKTLLQLNTDVNVADGTRTEFSRRFPLVVGSGSRRDVTIIDKDDNAQIELGSDAERELSDILDGKFILLYMRQDEDSLSTQETTDQSGNVLSLRLADSETITTEAIARLEFDWAGISGHAVQFNLEGAFNAVDGSLLQTLDTGTGPQTVDVPGANTRVEETRWDILLQDTWSNGKFELDYGLAAEFSEISQSGDADQKRHFTFIKPHSILSYSPNRENQTQLRIAREVSQLDFNDFISATVFEDDDLALGNPNLRPEDTWVLEVSHERRFGELGVVKLIAFHHWVSNVLDLLPITDEFEAPGNIGKGRRWGIEMAHTIPLQWLGLSGARLDINARWQDSTVVDPVTDQDRVLSGEKGFSGFSRTSNNAFRDDNKYAFRFDYRQDFEEDRVAWGWVVRTRSKRTIFNVNELDIYDEGVEVDAFIETTRWLGMKVSIIGENLTNATQLRERSVFEGRRELSLIDFREVEDDRDGVRITLQFSGNF
jgi:hypothetical protein